jgi:lipopolysaccharide/colanic/teichoic acid biosynthesis glycosyltransferase
VKVFPCRSRYVPFVRNGKIRTAISFLLLVLSAEISVKIFDYGRVEVIVSVYFLAWLVSVFLTEKHIHKYPQRYFTYLVASHLKAAFIMASLLWMLGSVAGVYAAPHDVLWSGFFLFIVSDLLVSFPYRRDVPKNQPSAVDPAPSGAVNAVERSGDSIEAGPAVSSPDQKSIFLQFHSDPDKPLIEFMEKHLPDLRGSALDVLVLEEEGAEGRPSGSAPVRLLVSRVRLNDVRRLNRFFLFCAQQITMGSYFVGRYMPLENDANELKRRYSGLFYRMAFLLHFIWYRAFPKIPWLNALYFSFTKGRNRVLSKVEIWGRLSYCGMRVILESEGDGERYLIAQRVAIPVQNRKPTYYPIVSLEKVGLDGEVFHTHKIRTMFPFSEFLQKRVFEDHGLASTGKFMNEYRLTEYGNFLRKYWLDELPGIFDWLRGDIKLVGIRAMSRHYLSLYPRNFYDLYIQIKPGLVPPIFDESTNGFDQIVNVELAYLQRYWEHPFQTDVRYLIQTFTDIVFKGIRSH